MLMITDCVAIIITMIIIANNTITITITTTFIITTHITTVCEHYQYLPTFVLLL
jgi:hypothetical protein